MQRQKVSVFWFRRDLRIEDNHGLSAALSSEFPVLPLFIFDTNIIDELPENDARISFIYDQLKKIADKTDVLCVKKGAPADIFQEILSEYDVQGVYTNEDYEPYAITRDGDISELLAGYNIELYSFKDQVIFAKDEVLKGDRSPYTVFTPYKNKWLEHFKQTGVQRFHSESGANYLRAKLSFPELSELGFVRSNIRVPSYDLDHLSNYEQERNFPALDATSHLSTHLRFGTVSIRLIIQKIRNNQVFLSELIWREFFMQILYHFPQVVSSSFKAKYDHIVWRNNVAEFEKWKKGETGYPMVDAGMRELNETGLMHNRVRMVVASFLCKHLLIDWRWGEAYFAEKLLDYELSSNNGNWQWAAGTGCDAAPYFRVFNPTEQVKKFDPELAYTRKWVPELDSLEYPTPMVDHKMARERAISTYKLGLESSSGS